MREATILWAGKRLTPHEERVTRDAVALFTRLGSEGAQHLQRFLPEGLHTWTPDELELGAHAGPWIAVDGGTAVD